MDERKRKRLERYKMKLEMYLEAEEAVLNAQSYKIGSREVTRADLSEITKMVEYLESRIDALEGCGGKRQSMRIIPRDI